MNKTLLRLIAILLLPCLIADPVSAAGVGSCSTRPLTTFPFVQSVSYAELFRQEALVGTALFASRRVYGPHLRRLANELLAHTYFQWHRGLSKTFLGKVSLTHYLTGDITPFQMDFPAAPISEPPTSLRLDLETEAHVDRVSRYAAILAEEAGLTPYQVERIQFASRFHDIGKLAVPKSILQKPGKLTEEEMTVMKKHTVIAPWFLQSYLQTSPDVLDIAIKIALYHQEWWDGSGYPRHLKGSEIPLEARIVALADVLDALLSKRPYKDAIPFSEAVASIKSESGTHFDPRLEQIFERAESRLEAESQRLEGLDTRAPTRSAAATAPVTPGLRPILVHIYRGDDRPPTAHERKLFGLDLGFHPLSRLQPLQVSSHEDETAGGRTERPKPPAAPKKASSKLRMILIPLALGATLLDHLSRGQGMLTVQAAGIDIFSFLLPGAVFGAVLLALRLLPPSVKDSLKIIPQDLNLTLRAA